MPRPSKFTATTRRVILEAAEVGASLRTQAQVAGIHHETLRDWLERGRKATEGAYHEFFVAHEGAEAAPKLRALGIIWRAMPDKPDLAWKFIERRESGFAPPAPQLPATATAPLVVNLSLSGGEPLPRWANTEVIDLATEVPALTDGGGNADPAAAT